MFNIISIHYLLLFLIFTYIIPISITFETKLQFVFFNGLNVIRCSDNQVQVYQPKGQHTPYLSTTLKCANKNDIYNPSYTTFLWSKLTIICSSDTSEVYEEQFVKKNFGGHKTIEQLPVPQGQLDQSTEPYDLEIEQTDDDDTIKIRSNDQPATDDYFNKNNNLKGRRIYIWFPEHPIICRIKFTGEDDKPCTSDGEHEIEEVDHACYYNPGAEQAPTIEEMEAELKQVEEAEQPDDSGIYVLDLEKADVDTPDNDSSNPSSDNNPKKSATTKSPAPSKSAKTKQDSSIIKTIGLILVILSLIVLIGGIGFYMIRKHRLNNSSSSPSSTNIENGNNKNLSTLVHNESQQSLANDNNTKISTNELSRKDQPNIALQTSNANKRQRTVTNMGFNQDM